MRRLLIANRGEIAARIARSAKALGIETVAVFSDPDEGAFHVRACDRAVRIGPAPASESYLNIEAILAAAKASGADAVHPGYGFLSENAGFARACAEAGLIFVGPPAEAIAAMGDKARAKAAMINSGVPTVPGWQGEDQSPETLAAEADRIGFPLLIKAAAGGGGRGMRAVDRAEDFADALSAAKREASSAFGDDAVLLEKRISPARHVEIQILADGHGNVVHLGERDCSAQRRRQKVIEEAPAPGLSPETRARMGADAVAAAKAVDYAGAGTVEFLLAPDGAHYFLEMNTRLQVEHPVTEMVTGLDLVDWQLRIARGEPVDFSQEDVRFDGHAVEARLYAEDPHEGFAPRSGPVLNFDISDPAPGVRIDAGVETGDAISPHYDPMVAKIIVHAPTRAQTLDRLNAALVRHPLLGPGTNRGFLIDLLSSPEFEAGALDVDALDRWREAGEGPFAARKASFEALALAALLECAPAPGALRSASVSRFDLPLTADGEPVALAVEQTGTGTIGVTLDGHTADLRLISQNGPRVRWVLDDVERTAFAVKSSEGWHVALEGRDVLVAEPSPWRDGAGDDPSIVTTPVTGLLAVVHAQPGDRVKAGDLLGVMEAMKMEMRLTAAADGTISSVSAAEGAQVSGGAVLFTLELDGSGGDA